MPETPHPTAISQDPTVVVDLGDPPCVRLVFLRNEFRGKDVFANALNVHGAGLGKLRQWANHGDLGIGVRPKPAMRLRKSWKPVVCGGCNDNSNANIGSDVAHHHAQTGAFELTDQLIDWPPSAV